MHPPTTYSLPLITPPPARARLVSAGAFVTQVLVTGSYISTVVVEEPAGGTPPTTYNLPLMTPPTVAVRALGMAVPEVQTFEVADGTALACADSADSPLAFTAVTT